MSGFNMFLGKYNQKIDSVVGQWEKNQFMDRMLHNDYTLWKENPKEITNRLGWLRSPEVMLNSLDEINSFVTEIRAAGFKQALLLGMGGSSLAPEVYARSFGVKKGFLDLAILDSTDPGAVLARERQMDLKKTLFIVATKSGGTVETFSFLKYFYNRMCAVVGVENAGTHFMAITDGGSGLESAAKELRFRKIFLNDPDIGGRYSALSCFGLIPAALVGINLKIMLSRAGKMMQNSFTGKDSSSLQLGAAMGVLAEQGIDKLTLIISPRIASFGAWIEQLVAESTGKEGRGILPVDGEEWFSPELYSSDRLFIHIRLEGEENYDEQVGNLINSGCPVIQIHLKNPEDLGAEIYRWEVATAAAGAHLGINPFDQPDVESAKVLARQMVASFQQTGLLPQLVPDFIHQDLKIYAGRQVDNFPDLMKNFFASARTVESGSTTRSYVALQVYLKPSPEIESALQGLRNRINLKYYLATTLGYGPRFLHSTGQLHKGDAGNGLFLQFLAEMPEDLPIPTEAGRTDSAISFGILKNSQALGDRQALLNAGRRVITINLGNDILAGIQTVREVI